MSESSELLRVAATSLEGASERVIVAWNGLIVVGQVLEFSRGRAVLAVRQLTPVCGSWVMVRFPGELARASAPRWQVVHVDDVVQGHRLVLKRGHVSEA